MRKIMLIREAESDIPLPQLDLSRLTKPVIVVTTVVIGFFVGEARGKPYHHGA